MKRWLKILIGVILFITLFVAKTLWSAGFFKTIEPHEEGNIKEIKGFTGSEDITIDNATGLAFISSSQYTPDAPKGSIFLLDINNPNPQPIKLTKTLKLEDFHPHGISLYQLPNGEKQLFLINHRKAGNYIEIFQFSDSTLTHKESISDPAFISPNDIVAVGERQFYITNDHDEKKSSWRTIKDLLQFPMGNVCYFDGKKGTIMSDNILYANGINVSLDKKKLFAASSSGNKILVFDRNTSTGDLKEADDISINGPDNIEFDEAGNMWVGCHPKLLAFLGHSKDHSKPSPSEVIKITYNGKDDAKLTTIYRNDGRYLSGSSVGAPWKDKLLIGTVFGEKVLLIEKK